MNYCKDYSYCICETKTFYDFIDNRNSYTHKNIQWTATTTNVLLQIDQSDFVQLLKFHLKCFPVYGITVILLHVYLLQTVSNCLCLNTPKLVMLSNSTTCTNTTFS